MGGRVGSVGGEWTKADSTLEQGGAGHKPGVGVREVSKLSSTRTHPVHHTTHTLAGPVNPAGRGVQDHTTPAPFRGVWRCYSRPPSKGHGRAATDGKSFFPGMQSFFPKSAFYCIFLHLTSIYLHRAAFAFCITSHSITSGNIFQAHMRQNADPTSCHINTTFDMSHWFAFTRIILHVSRKHSITLLDVNIHLDLYCIQQHFVRVHPI